MKIAIVSACYGIDLKIPSVINDENTDYHLFTDQDININNRGWAIHKNKFNSSIKKFNSRRSAKIFKVLPEYFLPDYDFYIWHDISHQLIMSPTTIINDYLKDEDFAVFKHRFRDSSLEELKFVIKHKVDSKSLLKSQLKEYKKNSELDKYGLYELPTFIKAKNSFTNNFSLMWWEQITKYSSRDQISFPYVCSKLQYAPKLLSGSAFGESANSLFEQFNFLKFDRSNPKI